MYNFKEFINEYYLANEKLNDYYYLAFDVHEGSINSLKNYKFKGITAISDSPKIIESFARMRSAILVMDKNKVNENNLLEKIDYDDINYLVKNNFEILYRISGLNILSTLMYEILFNNLVIPKINRFKDSNNLRKLNNYILRNYKLLMIGNDW
jgi:hypothetical protein